MARTLRRQSLSSLDHPGAYLRRTIVHLASNRRRSLARWRGAMSRLRDPDEGQDPEYSSDLADLLSLHPTSRALLYLIEVEGRAYADAAPMLGLSEQAARARASRARRQLRQEITGEQARSRTWADGSTGPQEGTGLSIVMPPESVIDLATDPATEPSTEEI